MISQLNARNTFVRGRAVDGLSRSSTIIRIISLRRLGAGLLLASNAAISCGGIFCHGIQGLHEPVSEDGSTDVDGTGFPTESSTLDWLSISADDDELLEDAESSNVGGVLTDQLGEPLPTKYKIRKQFLFL